MTGLSQATARKQLIALQDKYGDTFTPEFTLKIGKVWRLGSDIVDVRFNGDYTPLMRSINKHVDLFVFGSQQTY